MKRKIVKEKFQNEPEWILSVLDGVVSSVSSSSVDVINLQCDVVAVLSHLLDQFVHHQQCFWNVLMFRNGVNVQLCEPQLCACDLA